jgi:molybdenum cofactor cytidylyltransferase
MNLRHALRLADTTRLALVGSGGKSSALFQLARQFMPPVIVTSTTHLAVSQAAWADVWTIASEPQDVLDAGRALGQQVLLFTGPREDAKRLKGVDQAVLEEIYALVERLECPLLVEADGSRRLPLKAPAAHEPAVPSFCDTVVVVAGLSALEKPLTSEWVHRVERYSELSNISVGEIITMNGSARVLLHPQGGLKNIPGGARRAVLLNQADTPELQSRAKSLGEVLLGGFDSVLVGSLHSSGEPEGSLGGAPESGGVHAVYERIAGIVLAAGGSQRFGEPKLLKPWKDEPIVRHVVKTALAAGLNPVVLVAGDRLTEFQEITSDLEITVVHNSDWQQGQSSSLKAGLSALPGGVGGAIFFLGDQPQTPASLVRSLVEAHSASLAPIVAPLIDGQRGNPVLFDRQTFPELMELSGDVGGRPLFARYPIAWVPWYDSSVLLDVDTLDDYWRLQHLQP